MSVVIQGSGRLEFLSHRFYLGMAVACAAVAFAGFAPTYWAPMASGSLRVAPVIHLHATFFFVWVLFFVLQTALVAGGRHGLHRELGMAGIALATAMVFTGVMASIHSLLDGMALGVGDAARAFFLVPLSGIGFFAAVIGYALVNVKRPERHKRAMLLATISLLQAAVARWFMAPDAVGPPPVIFSVVPGLISDLLLVGAVVYDWRTRGRPHAVYVVGGGVLLLIQVVRVPLSATPAWFAVADWWAALAG